MKDRKEINQIWKLPYGEGTHSNDGVIKMSSKDNNGHKVPNLQAQHNGRSNGKLHKIPQVLKRQPGQPLPALSTPSYNIHHLSYGDPPRRHVVRGRSAGGPPVEDSDEEIEKADVEDQSPEPDPGQDPDPALGLEELLGGEIDGEREHLRDYLDGEFPGEVCDLGLLSEELEDWSGEDVEWE